MAKVIGAALLFLTAALGADGSCRVVVRRGYAPFVYRPVYYPAYTYPRYDYTPRREVRILTYDVPTVYVSFGQPQASGPDLTPLLQELQQLRQQLGGQGRGAAGQAPAMPPPEGPEGVGAQASGAPAVKGGGLRPATQHCGVCHGGTQGVKGGFALVKGEARLKIEADRLGDGLEHVLRGTMPKDHKLTDAEKVAVSLDLMAE